MFGGLQHLAAVVGLVLALRAGKAPALTVVDERALAQTLSAEAARPRLVHFWASWCGPCVAEMPGLLRSLRALRGRPIDVVLVSLDEDKTEGAAIRALGRAGGWPGRSLRATGHALAAIKHFDGEWDGAIPTTYLIDAAGRLVLAQRGGTEIDVLVHEVDRIVPRRKP